MKKISIVMSCYNETENELAQAIESILNQEYKDFEFIIIIDNPGNSNLLDVVKKYALIDTRINIICNHENIGLARSLNKGIQIAEGEYVARMDADDISLPSRLGMQVEYLNANRECTLVCSNFIKIDQEGNEIGINKTVPKSDEALGELIKYQYIIAHPTVMMRKENLCKIGMYNNYRAAQDYDLWLRMVKNGYRMHYINEPLIKYRYRKESVGSTKKSIQFLSCQFARNLFYKNRLFDENEYSKYIKEKLEDLHYMKGVELYYRWFSNRSPDSLFKSVVINKDCRREFLNILRGKKWSMKIEG